MFIEVIVKTNEEASEILMAELSEIGFSMFQEDSLGFKGYIEEENFNKILLEDVKLKYDESFPIDYSIRKIEKVNWNEEWEKNFQPIEIDGICRIRASFHQPDPKFKYEVIIDPKMTFGTGHHSTTALMIGFQLNQNYREKDVADIGCGTGILAIMASKLGAKRVVGLEIEDWSVVNARENAFENGCQNIEVYEGKVKDNLKNQKFDIVLANINKNVLLEEMPEYKQILKPKGELLLSGFYKGDIPDIENRAEQFKLKKMEWRENENWVAVRFLNCE